MPTLTVTLPPKRFAEVKKQARREGFSDPTKWASFVIERSACFEESPKIKPAKIISSMKKTGLYKEIFLRELKQSLEYADRAA